MGSSLRERYGSRLDMAKIASCLCLEVGRAFLIIYLMRVKYLIGKVKITHRQFSDPRLTPQANKACEMLFNGFDWPEIEDEMDISARHLSQLFYLARSEGVDVPTARSGARRGPTAARCSTERLLHLSGQLRSPTLVAARVGLTYGAVWRRLRRAA